MSYIGKPHARHCVSGRVLIKKCRLVISGAAIAGVLLAGGQDLRAETLKDALASAYMNNPELRAERARQRATDESVPQALSGFRPVITGTGDLGKSRSKSWGLGAPVVTRLKPSGYGINITQPIFNGLRTVNGVKQAESGVLAGREALLNVEQNVLLSSVTAYLDVLRDTAILRLRRNNLNVLSEQLRSTQARFDVGELTRTDVAQARARRSGALSELNSARANLATSRAVFRQNVGHAPGSLRYPRSVSSRLPRSKKAAYRIAMNEHPAILAAMYTEESARHGIKVTKGELYPIVSVVGDYSRRKNPSSITRRTTSASITGRITVPLYQGGTVYSRLRQAKHTHAQRYLELDKMRAAVRASVSSAWEGLMAARAQITSAKQQVRAGRIALEGVRQEAKVGQRTTLDVLNAQQELLDARVSLVLVERNATVAAYSLLSATGRLSARHLALPVKYYDPGENYKGVRNKWIGARIIKGD